MKITIKQVFSFLLILTLCISSLLTPVVAENEALAFDAKLLAQEFGQDLYYSWDSFSHEPDKMIKMAGLLITDALNGIPDPGFTADKIELAYAFSFMDGPSVMLYANQHCYALYAHSPSNVLFSDLAVVENIEQAENAVKQMAENDVWADPRKLDLDTLKTYLGYKPVQSADLINSPEQQLLFRQADYVSPYSAGWFAFVKQDTAGFINTDGEMLLGNWNRTWQFDHETETAIVYQGNTDRLRPVLNEDNTAQGNYGIIDAQGNVVLPMEYDEIRNIGQGIAAVTAKDRTEHLFNLKSREFIIPDDKDICHWKDYSEGGLICSFKGTWDPAARKGDGKWGYIDLSGKTVIPFDYESATGFWYGGKTEVKKNGRYGVIDQENNVIIPFTWDYVSLSESSIVGVRDKAYYLLDENGIIQYEFPTSSVSSDDYGHFFVYDNAPIDEKGALIDKEGNYLLKPEWYFVDVIDDHRAVVTKLKGEDRKKGVIDYLTGDILVPLIYDDIQLFYHADDGSSEGIRYFSQLDYYGFFDESFNVISMPQYTKVTVFSHGYAAVKDADGWKIIDKTGKVIL